MIVFLASECGWDHDFILDHLTWTQLRTYYELINKKKLRELKIKTIAMFNAVAYSYGSMKKEAFMKFIDKLDPPKITKDGTAAFENMKDAGFPVEESE